MINSPLCAIDKLEWRTLNAYFRFSGAQAGQPCAASTKVHEVAGKVYLTLGNVNGLLACYRVEKSGRLRRVEALPAELAEGGPTRDDGC